VYDLTVSASILCACVLAWDACLRDATGQPLPVSFALPMPGLYCVHRVSFCNCAAVQKLAVGQSLVQWSCHLMMVLCACNLCQIQRYGPSVCCCNAHKRAACLQGSCCSIQQPLLNPCDITSRSSGASVTSSHTVRQAWQRQMLPSATVLTGAVGFPSSDPAVGFEPITYA
jgi:hypothetical protein